MYRASLFFVSVVVVCCATSTSPGFVLASEPLSHRLSIQYAGGVVRDFWVGDCDGDGWDDYIPRGLPQEGCTDRINMFRIVGGTIESIDQINIRQGEIGTAHAADLDRDGRPEILVGLSDGSGVWLEAWQPTPTRLLRRSVVIPTPDRDGSGRWDGGLKVRGCVDLDLDGFPDVVCTIGAGMDMKPRGVLVFSGATWEIIGEYETAGPISRLKVSQPRNPSDTVILFSTTAVKNGNRVGIFTDDKSYLHVLDRKCKFLWGNRGAVGQTPWGFDCADLDADGDCEVIFSRESMEGRPAKPYKIEIKDAIENETVTSIGLPVQITEIDAIDLDADTKAELVTVMRDNTIRIFDQEVNELKQAPQDAHVAIRGVHDLDFDGKPEIVATIGSNSLVVLDRHLRTIARQEFPSRIMKVSFAEGERSSGCLLALAGEEITIMKLSRNFVVLGRTSPAWLALTAALGLLVGSAVGGTIAVARTRSRSGARKQLRSERARDELLVSLTEFGHSGLARSNLGRLAQYCETVPEPGTAKRAEHEQRLASIVATYRDFTRGLLLKIAGLGGEWSQSRAAASKLRRNIEELDEVLPPKDDRGSYLPRALRESKKISATARTIHDEIVSLRRDVLATYRADVPGAVCRVVASVRERLAEQGVTKVLTSFEGQGIAHVDDESLKACLEILLSNAAEAMAGSERREITIAVVDLEDAVILDVTDSGSGVERADWERIFDRDFTSKGEGHGLGLYHTRQTLARHGASVKVRTSSPSQGTTMTVRLRSADSTRPASRGALGETRPGT